MQTLRVIVLYAASDRAQHHLSHWLDKELILFLDNFEHLAENAEELLARSAVTLFIQRANQVADGSIPGQDDLLAIAHSVLEAARFRLTGSLQSWQLHFRTHQLFTLLSNCKHRYYPQYKSNAGDQRGMLMQRVG